MTGNQRLQEAALRRGMSEFVEAQHGPGLAIPDLLDRCRRVRRRRRVTFAAAAGVLAIAAVTGAVATTQQSVTVTVTPAASSSATGTLPPLSLKPRAEDHTFQGSLPLPQPAHPGIGTSYAYNWYAHCGMVYISFDGKVWKADEPVAVPKMHPDAKGVTWGPPIVPGYVTLLSPTTLRFDAPTYITGVPLHITTDKVPICS